MRILPTLTFVMLLFGCEARKPAISDTEFADLKTGRPGMTEACLNEIRYGGGLARDFDDPQCYGMLPAKRWTGLWEHGWEWTNFCPDPAKQCQWMSKRGIWLTFAEGARPTQELPDGIHRIEFVGRRTKVPGNFGHLNSYEHLMVVDRVIGIQTIRGEEHRKKQCTGISRCHDVLAQGLQ